MPFKYHFGALLAIGALSAWWQKDTLAALVTHYVWQRLATRAKRCQGSNLFLPSAVMRHHPPSPPPPPPGSERLVIGTLETEEPWHMVCGVRHLMDFGTVGAGGLCQSPVSNHLFAA